MEIELVFGRLANDRWSTVVFSLLLISLPFGAAVHSVAAFLSIMISVFFLGGNAPGFRTGAWGKILIPPVVFASGVIGVTVLASALNDATSASLFSEILGYGFWALGPSLILWALPPVSRLGWTRIGMMTAIGLVMWGAVCLSQNLWGWQVRGAAVVEASTRARGFYSHPLSLAYVALLVWPVCLHWWGVASKKSWPTLAIFGCASLLLFSQSRMVQVTAALVFLVVLWRYCRGRVRLLAFAGCLLVGVGLWCTDNSISHKFKRTISEQGLDRLGHYPDDRFAFWHAHLEMFRDKPVIGHGYGTDYDYRSSYYEKIGLGGFVKKYTAHNLFLQLMVNGGVVGLFFFLSWLVWVWRLPRIFLPAGHWLQGLTADTIFAFVMASLTQNSLYDMYVRTCLVLLTAALLSAIGLHRLENHPENSA